MTVKEFLNNNSDIIGERIMADDLLSIPEYQVLFMIITSGKAKEMNKPIEERNILDVCHIMPVFTGQNMMFYIKGTKNWNAVAGQLAPYDLSKPQANCMLFHITPFTFEDRRRSLGWEYWSAQ